MSRRPFRLPAEGRPFLELASLGRTGPTGQWLSAAQIEQIRRTVRRTPLWGATHNGVYVESALMWRKRPPKHCIGRLRVM